ncbi:folylpolyglutamate synthase [Rhypophila decipiens]|uniref:tetrahydrofolate synthase n=1 Tax=Rhypophila decipiens TaxID=261697 RepID=A0AAN7B348_9PEZI|nr:folylpolyglutamate synthase [Rhypophila decipiens]
MITNRLNTSTRQLCQLFHTCQLRSRSALTLAASKIHLRTLHLSHRHLQVGPIRPVQLFSPTSTSTSMSTQKRPLSSSSSSAKMSEPTKRRRRVETYEEALRRLSLLQSNKQIVNLFGNDSSAPKTEDINAQAMPEMLAWLARAGYTPSSLTESGLRVVHVAGTKGKGSVSTLVSSILTEYRNDYYELPDGTRKNPVGNKVGLYTSPHVLSVRERIQLDGVPISRELFTKYFFELWDRLSEAAREKGDLLPASSIQTRTSLEQPQSTTTETAEGKEEEEDEYDGPATKPFYFRFLTLLAFHVFVREGVRSAVVECGIGGEYDPTNILEPECVTVSVITQLGIDHVSMLGDTLPKIAWHKAGIFKEGRWAYTRALQGEEGEEVMKVLRQRSVHELPDKTRGFTILTPVEDSEVEEWWNSEVGQKIARGAKLQGPFQKYNMALAAKAAKHHLFWMGLFLGKSDLKDMPEDFVKGLMKASLRGRCEKLHDRLHRTNWFIDGAHTEDSLRGVGEWFAGRKEYFEAEEPHILLFNQQDRDPAVLIRALLSGLGDRKKSEFTVAIFTRNEEKPPGDGEPPRDLSVQEKARDAFLEVVGEEADVETFTMDSVAASVELIWQYANMGKEDPWSDVLVTGSFHLAGAVLKTIDRWGRC